MKILPNTFLSNRFFLAWGVGIIWFSLGFVWHPFIYVGWSWYGLVLGYLGYETFLLYRKKQPIQGFRETPKILSLSDKNQIVYQLNSRSETSFRFELIDEFPHQFQIRDFHHEGKLAAEDEKRIQLALRPVKRGVYSFGDINLILEVALGLIQRRVLLPAKTEIPCYPSIIQMEMYELMVFSADRNQVGIKKIRKLGHGYEFSDIRQYVTGDDPRTINWKASSRSGNIMVNNYVDERSQQIYTVIDHSRVMRMPFNDLSLLDYAINASLSLQNIVLRNQDHAGLITFAGKAGTFIPADRKTDQRERILKALYNLEETQEENNFVALHETLKTKLKSRSMLLLMTHFQSLNAVVRILPQLQRINHDHLLTVVFFENTELTDFRKSDPHHTLDVAAQVLAGKLQNELTQAIFLLRQSGIQVIYTAPEDLSTNSINKYLEMKSRGFI